MARTRRSRYSEEFRADAVALVRKSGRPVAQLARELGIDDSTLNRRRLHGSLGYMTPEEFEEHFTEQQAA